MRNLRETASKDPLYHPAILGDSDSDFGKSRASASKRSLGRTPKKKVAAKPIP